MLSFYPIFPLLFPILVKSLFSEISNQGIWKNDRDIFVVTTTRGTFSRQGAPRAIQHCPAQ